MQYSDLADHRIWSTAVIPLLVGISSSLLTNLLAYANFRRRYLLEDRTEFVIRGLFRSGWETRKFTTIQNFIPLEESELRHALLRAGAVRLRGTGEDEQWGILERHGKQVFRRKTEK